MSNFTKVGHTGPYAAISPSRPELTQSGRTVLVTGGGTGIGFAIARAFIAASAARVIILGRRESTLADAKAELATKSTSTVVEFEKCDVSDQTSVDALWQALSDKNIDVDVLVLNAADTEDVPSLLNLDAWDRMRSAYKTNLFGGYRMALQFFNQGKKTGKALMNISTVAAHWNPALLRAYSTTKASFTHLCQVLACEMKVEEAQIISFHPGSVFTPAAAAAGYTETSMAWDNVDLPGHFAVWASSKEAAFLHGTMLWARWDVNELLSMKLKISEDPGFLKLGLQGVEHVNSATFFN